MSQMIELHGLQVAPELKEFAENRALPGTGIEPDAFWKALSDLLHDLAPRNRELLAVRDDLQSRIDEWCRARQGGSVDGAEYETFLREIGYLVEDKGGVTVETTKVDPEIASVAGPQLVVPVTNARYALNAANARWGSLYDALYGTDAISEDDGAEKGRGYNPKRGEKVIAWAREFLNASAPICRSASTAWRWSPPTGTARSTARS